MLLIFTGLILFAAGVGWWFPPAGLMVLGLGLVAVGAARDLLEDAPEDAPS